jgi:hypothetical protein
MHADMHKKNKIFFISGCLRGKWPAQARQAGLEDMIFIGNP